MTLHGDFRCRSLCPSGTMMQVQLVKCRLALLSDQARKNLIRFRTGPASDQIREQGVLLELFRVPSRRFEEIFDEGLSCSGWGVR
jgi:hypothetical protein